MPRSLTPIRRRVAVALAIGLSLSFATACSSIKTNPPQSNPNEDTRAAKEGGTLRVALAAEPDALDPTTRSHPGRADRLHLDLREALRHRRQAHHRAAARRGAADRLGRRQDRHHQAADRASSSPTARTMDAAAVKTSLDRHMTLAGSARKSELASVASVAVTDPSTVTLNLKAPFAPLTALLADRAGMIMSPTALDSPRATSSAPTRSASARSSSPPGSPRTASRWSRTRTTTTRPRCTWTRSSTGSSPTPTTRFNNLQLRRRRGPRRGRRHRRRRAQGRRQAVPADLGLARVPGHHHQHRQRQRRRQAGRRRCRRPTPARWPPTPGCARRSS